MTTHQKLEPGFLFMCKGGKRGSIEVRTTHEVMALGATQLALFIMQFRATTRTPAPVFTGDIATVRVRFTGLLAGLLFGIRIGHAAKDSGSIQMLKPALSAAK